MSICVVIQEVVLTMLTNEDVNEKRMKYTYLAVFTKKRFECFE